MDVTILLDPKVSVETQGFSKLVSWSLNDYDLFIDFEQIGHLLTGFARITHYQSSIVRNELTKIKIISFEEGFIAEGYMDGYAR